MMAQARTQPSEGVSPLKVLLWVALGTVLISALLAAGISKLMWGYAFARPAPDHRVSACSNAIAVTCIDISTDSGHAEFVPSKQWDVTSWLGYASQVPRDPEFDYYLLEHRVLLDLEARGLVSAANPPMSRTADELRGLLPRLRTIGSLAQDSPGYNQLVPGISEGVVYELAGSDGEPLVLVAWSGAEVSNDHHPYYEHLLAGTLPISAGPPNASTAPKLISRTQFCFDVAGLEGMEFPGMFLGFSTLGLMVTLSLTGLLLLHQWRNRRVAQAHGCCPLCRYDLRGLPTGSACPECGGRDAPAASGTLPATTRTGL